MVKWILKSGNWYATSSAKYFSLHQSDAFKHDIRVIAEAELLFLNRVIGTSVPEGGGPLRIVRLVKKAS
jgi:hypothetical protein